MIRTSVMSAHLESVTQLASSAYDLGVASVGSNSMLLDMVTVANNVATGALEEAVTACNISKSVIGVANGALEAATSAERLAHAACNNAAVLLENTTKAGDTALSAMLASLTGVFKATAASNMAVEALDISQSNTDLIADLDADYVGFCNVVLGVMEDYWGLSNEMSVVEARFWGLSNVVMDGQSGLGALWVDHNELKSMHVGLSNSVWGIKGDVDVLKTNLTSLTNQTNNINDNLMSLNIRHDVLVADHESLSNSTRTMLANLATVTSNVSQNTIKITDLQGLSNAVMSDGWGLSNQVLVRGAQLDALDGKVGTLSNNLGNLNDTFVALVQDYVGVSNEVGVIETRLADAFGVADRFIALSNAVMNETAAARLRAEQALSLDGGYVTGTVGAFRLRIG